MGEKISSIYSDLESGKALLEKVIKGLAVFGWFIILILLLAAIRLIF